MTLYETIFTRRQVRNFLNSPVPKDHLDHILACATEAEQLTGQHADFKLLPAAEVSANQGGPIIYSVSAIIHRLPMPMSVLYCKRLTCVSRTWG